MAQQVLVKLIDDLDGSEAAETIKYALDGVSYEIDLSGGNAEKLRRALEPFIEASRRTGGRRRPVPGADVPTPRASSRANETASDLTPQERLALRAWASENGFNVAERGRIAKEVLTAWREAGSPL